MTMITHTVNSLQQSADLPQGRAWVVAPPCQAKKKKTRSMQDKLNNVLRSDILPLEAKRACIFAGKELRFTQDECLVAAFWTSVLAVPTRPRLEMRETAARLANAPQHRPIFSALSRTVPMQTSGGTFGAFVMQSCAHGSFEVAGTAGVEEAARGRGTDTFLTCVLCAGVLGVPSPGVHRCPGSTWWEPFATGTDTLAGEKDP